MEGLAKRLRKLSEYVIQAPPVEYEQAASWAMSDAADAIEMQTAALTALRLQCRDHEKAVEAMRAENAKLREALLDSRCPYPVVKNDETVRGCIHADMCGCSNYLALADAASRARAREVDGQADGE